MGENCGECLQAKSLDEKIRSVWKELEKQYAKLDDCEKRVTAVESDTNELKVLFKNIKETIDKIDQKLDKLTEVPGQKWDKATTAIMVAVISTLVGMAIGKIF
jgi:predicted  nucleic acid-binding Zn-ribbon protein